MKNTRPSPEFDARARISCIALWSIMLITITAISTQPNYRRTVTPCYRTASTAFAQNESLYTQDKEFLYLPHAAIAFTPITWLPTRLGEGVWRIASLLAFVCGLRSMHRSITKHRGRSPSDAQFLWLSILTIPLIWSAARNGQSTILLAACGMGFAVSLGNGWWWRAAGVATVGLIAKPYMVVIILLAMPLHPLFAWRMLACLIGLTFLPLVFAPWEYVARTMHEFALVLRDDRVMPWDGAGFSDIFRLLYTFGVDVPGQWQTRLRLVAAGVTFTIAWRLHRRRPPAALMLFPLAAMYLVLFSPRIENNTYALIAPVIAWVVVDASANLRSWRTLGLVVVLAMMFAHRSLAGFFGDDRGLWVLPLGAVIFTLDGLIRPRFRRRPRERRQWKPIGRSVAEAESATQAR